MIIPGKLPLQLKLVQLHQIKRSFPCAEIQLPVIMGVLQVAQQELEQRMILHFRHGRPESLLKGLIVLLHRIDVAGDQAELVLFLPRFAVAEDPFGQPLDRRIEAFAGSHCQGQRQDH
ncbi:hypothetical protein D3C75_527390 [compost metagenome]